MSPRKNNENRYEFLNTSARKSVFKIRQRLEAYFNLYPEDEKEEMKNRLKTEEHFDSTLFEMFLYYQLKNDDFKIELHPNLEGTNNKPDFLLTKKNKKIYLEAKVDHNKSFEERKRNRIEKVIKDVINRFSIGNYRLVLEDLVVKSSNSPSTEEFKNSIKEKIKKLDGGKKSKLTDDSFEKSGSYVYEDNNLRIKYKVFVVPKDYNDNRSIQIDGAVEAVWVDSGVSLRKSLNKKASRYGEMNAPFIIALNCLDLFIDEEEVEIGLFGDKKSKVFLNNDSVELIVKENYHENNGFFSNTSPSKNNNVSAVLIYHLGVGNLENPTYWFKINPNAKYPIDPIIFPFSLSH